VQLGYLPLYGGDATVGSVGTVAFSGRLAYRLPVGARGAALEGYFEHAPQDTDPYNRAPGLSFAGLALRQSLGLDPAARLDPFLSAGLGWMRIDAEEIVCRLPECFAEGGPSFRDGDVATITLGAGLLVPLGRRAALRVDGRGFIPVGGPGGGSDNGKFRPELAGGVQARF
jgi:hypothetical protein